MDRETIALEITFKNGKPVAREMKDIADHAERVPKHVERTEKAMRMLKRTAAGAAIALIALFTQGIRDAIAFEAQMANVATMLDQHSMHHLPQFSREIKRMRVDFGETSAALTKGAYDILSAGTGPAKAMNVLRVSAMAARAGLTDTGTAADAVTTILNSYGLAASKATDVSDILFATVKRGKTTFGELASGIGMVSSTASVSGLRLEELSAFLATMTRNGVRTTEAITSVNAVLATFLQPTPEAAKLAREFGFELNTATLRGEGLLGVMEKLNGATAEQIAMLFPNVRALRGLAAALKDVEGFTADYQLALDHAGLMQEAFNKNADTGQHHLKRLWEWMKITAEEAAGPFAWALGKGAEAFINYRMEVEAETQRALEMFQARKFVGPPEAPRAPLGPQGGIDISGGFSLVGGAAAPRGGDGASIPTSFMGAGGGVGMRGMPEVDREILSGGQLLAQMPEMIRVTEEAFAQAEAGIVPILQREAAEVEALNNKMKTVQDVAMIMGSAISGAFSAMASGAMSVGDALLSSVLGALGTIATMWGSFLVSVGMGMTFIPGMQQGAGAVAYGAALLALGGTLQGMAGSMGRGGGGGGRVGGYGGGGVPYSSGGSSNGGGGINVFIVPVDGRVTSGGRDIERGLRSSGVDGMQVRSLVQQIKHINRTGTNVAKL